MIKTVPLSTIEKGVKFEFKNGKEYTLLVNDSGKRFKANKSNIYPITPDEEECLVTTKVVAIQLEELHLGMYFKFNGKQHNKTAPSNAKDSDGNRVWIDPSSWVEIIDPKDVVRKD